VDGTNFKRIPLRASTSQYVSFSKKERKNMPLKNDAPIDTLLPVLYRKGISIGDMMPALEALLGPHTPGLSATNIVRLKRACSFPEL
jgi:hypothetical protein